MACARSKPCFVSRGPKNSLPILSLRGNHSSTTEGRKIPEKSSFRWNITACLPRMPNIVTIMIRHEERKREREERSMEEKRGERWRGEKACCAYAKCASKEMDGCLVGRARVCKNSGFRPASSLPPFSFFFPHRVLDPGQPPVARSSLVSSPPPT